jgi:ABC-type Mn2+/Zn2+ transport system permease subunit
VTLAPYLQRALIEMILLAGLAGVLGTWIVLRGLAFFTHAIGTAAFPGLVVAGPWGIPAQLAGLGAALGFGGALERLARTRRVDTDAATGLLLVGALAVGVVLASDVYHSGAGVDRLLFGSLIALEPSDLWLTAAALAAAVIANAGLARAWLAGGFDTDAARTSGVRTTMADRGLLIAVAAAVAVCLSAVGALLVSVVLVVPAATVRRFEPRPRVWQAATVALAAVEGVIAVLAADALDVGAGPAMAVIGAAVFAAVSVAR